MEEALKKKVSTNARKARVSLGMTQQDAAEAIGVSVEFYSRIERGTALPSLKTCIRMAVAFEVSTDKLVGLAEDDDVTSAIEQYKAPPPEDPPELKRIFRRLRKASPFFLQRADNTIREMEKLQDQAIEEYKSRTESGAKKKSRAKADARDKPSKSQPKGNGQSSGEDIEGGEGGEDTDE